MSIQVGANRTLADLIPRTFFVSERDELPFLFSLFSLSSNNMEAPEASIAEAGADLEEQQRREAEQEEKRGRKPTRRDLSPASKRGSEGKQLPQKTIEERAIEKSAREQVCARSFARCTVCRSLACVGVFVCLSLFVCVVCCVYVCVCYVSSERA